MNQKRKAEKKTMKSVPLKATPSVKTLVMNPQRKTIDMPKPKVDKLQLVLPHGVIPEHDLEAAGERIAGMPGVKKLTSKGDGYKTVYRLRCPGGAKVTFSLIRVRSGMHHDLKIILNPEHFRTDDDICALRECLRTLFSFNGGITAFSQMLIQRVDLAYDVPVDIGELIIRLRGSPSEQKYFVRTDRHGKVESWYAGSISSKIHWVMYDQIASDAYKAMHRERPTNLIQADVKDLVYEAWTLANGNQPRRLNPKSDAEFVVGRVSGGGSITRFEARLVFKTPCTLAEYEAKRAMLEDFDVYQISVNKLAGAPENFGLFLDSVRFRGLAGAQAHYRATHPSRAGKKQLELFVSYLMGCAAPFWNKAKLDSSIIAGLQDQPIWQILKRLHLGDGDSGRS